MKEWRRRFEHGFSQIVDWLYLLDDLKQTGKFQKSLRYGHIDFTGLLLIGRNDGLDDDDKRRFRWRKHRVIVDSHPIICMTFDDLYIDLKERFDLFAVAFNAITEVKK